MKTILLPVTMQNHLISSDKCQEIKYFAGIVSNDEQNTANYWRKTKWYLMSLLLPLFMIQTVVLGQTTMAHFGLNNNLNVDNDNVSGTPVATQSNLTPSNTTAPCEGTYHYYAQGDGDYLQIDINTTGFTSISISWQQKQSTAGGGPHNGNWYLYGDANNDGNYEYNKLDNAAVTSACATITVNLDNSFNNKSAIRLRLTSNVTNGTYLLLDDITIRGCILPAAYNVTGGGSYCPGGSGVVVGLSNSETGVTYQLYRDVTNIVGTPISGATGSSISFGNQTIIGSYTVVATSTSGGCSNNMAGSAAINENAVPTASVNDQKNPTCYAGTDGEITIEGIGGTSPYSYSVDDGANWTPILPVLPNPYKYEGLTANTAYRIKVKDSNGCISR